MPGQRAHAHFAAKATVDVPVTTDLPPSAIDPRALLRKEVVKPRGENKYPRFKKGLALARDLGVPVTFERLRVLEQVIAAAEKTNCDDILTPREVIPLARVDDDDPDSDTESRASKRSRRSLADRISDGSEEDDYSDSAGDQANGPPSDDDDAVSLGSFDLDDEMAQLAGFADDA